MTVVISGSLPESLVGFVDCVSVARHLLHENRKDLVSVELGKFLIKLGAI